MFAIAKQRNMCYITTVVQFNGVQKMDQDKYYTISEVNQLIPNVELRLNQIAQINAQLNDCLGELDQLELTITDSSLPDIDEYTLVSCDIKLLKTALEKKFDQLTEMGCIIDELDKGVLYWPSKHKKDEIWLSWHQGERTISHWVDLGHTQERHSMSELNEL